MKSGRFIFVVVERDVLKSMSHKMLHRLQLMITNLLRVPRLPFDHFIESQRELSSTRSEHALVLLRVKR